MGYKSLYYIGVKRKKSFFVCALKIVDLKKISHYNMAYSNKREIFKLKFRGYTMAIWKNSLKNYKLYKIQNQTYYFAYKYKNMQISFFSKKLY